MAPSGVRRLQNLHARSLWLMTEPPLGSEYSGATPEVPHAGQLIRSGPPYRLPRCHYLGCPPRTMVSAGVTGFTGATSFWTTGTRLTIRRAAVLPPSVGFAACPGEYGSLVFVLRFDIFQSTVTTRQVVIKQCCVYSNTRHVTTCAITRKQYIYIYYARKYIYIYIYIFKYTKISQMLCVYI